MPRAPNLNCRTPLFVLQRYIKFFGRTSKSTDPAQIHELTALNTDKLFFSLSGTSLLTIASMSMNSSQFQTCSTTQEAALTPFRCQDRKQPKEGGDDES
jgi:hypothetical protein